MTIPDNHVRDHSRESLRDAMQNSLNRAPLFCCEGVETVNEVVRRTWRVNWLIVVPSVVVGLVVGWIAMSYAAQPADHMRPHEITLYLPPQADRVNIITISGPYTNRGKCEEAKAGVTVKAPGAKLVCGIADPFRVR